MDVKQIVLQYLKDNGYDGLANDDGESGCDLEDLMPCGYQDAFCEAGHKVEVSPEESEYGEDWAIMPGKRPEGGAEVMMPTTSFRLLHDAGACKERYRFLAKALGGIKAYGRDTPITLLQILNVNGLDDALWALRACPDSDTFARLLACDYAEHVLRIFETQYPDDDRPREAIAVSRRYARGEATDAELSAAWAAAWNAAWDAAEDAAWNAAWNAAGTAERATKAATKAAAEDAAWAAARAAAWAAAEDARDAERQWQVERLGEILKEV